MTRTHKIIEKILRTKSTKCTEDNDCKSWFDANYGLVEVQATVYKWTVLFVHECSLGRGLEALGLE